MLPMLIQIAYKFIKGEGKYWNIYYPNLNAYTNNSRGGLLRNKIIVQYGDRVIYLDEDARASIVLLKVFPLVSPPVSWTIREKACQVGAVKSAFMSSRKFLYFYNDTYEVCAHSRGKYSLTKNGEQIAVWQKLRVPGKDWYCYQVGCVKMSPLVPFMACVLSERADSSGVGGTMPVDTWYEAATIVPYDKWKSRANWRPPLDESKDPPAPKPEETKDYL